MKRKETFTVRLREWTREEVATFANHALTILKDELQVEGFSNIESFTATDSRLTRKRCQDLLVKVIGHCCPVTISYWFQTIRSNQPRSGYDHSRYAIPTSLNQAHEFRSSVFNWLIFIITETIVAEHSIQACLVHKHPEVRRLAKVKLGVERKKKSQIKRNANEHRFHDESA